MKHLGVHLGEKERQVVDEVLQHYSVPNEHLRPLTLDRLVRDWVLFVGTVERGYTDSIYEYANDLAVRDVLQAVIDALAGLPDSNLGEVLRPWDKRFMEATSQSSSPVPGLFGPSGTGSPWWFRIPRVLAGELLADMRAEGMVRQES